MEGLKFSTCSQQAVPMLTALSHMESPFHTLKANT